MKFWTGNRIDGEHEAHPADVAIRFAAWYGEQPDWYRNGIPLDIVLRKWLSENEGAWTDESETTGLGKLWHLVYALVFDSPQTSEERELVAAVRAGATGCEPVRIVAEIDISDGPHHSYPDYSVNHIS